MYGKKKSRQIEWCNQITINQSQGSFIIFCKQDVIGMTVNANKKKEYRREKTGGD